ncbi:hypothetical protein BT63DRAFT_480272 [Microthyrium microscopicum]|uniref:Uncharacterized protein n=1 Tax=Microthyrium microscopicum TaxID=703497 RepID=A0A6A6U7K8_9PEZI|nr:hypothetical protein BT63DRAFT_480272 [Microthyrium microscopicum]
MPRILPWLVEAETKIKSSPTTKRTQKRRSPSQDAEHSDFTDGSPPRKRVRQPSSSPPPPLPREEYMIEGYDNDDAWQMVEDELFATAQIFTAHIHRADYKKRKERLQRDSRTRNTNSKAKMSYENRMVKRAEEQRKKAGRALPAVSERKDDGDSDDSEDPFENPFLQDKTLAALVGNRGDKYLPKVPLIVRKPVRASTPSESPSPRVLPTRRQKDQKVNPVSDDLDNLDLDTPNTKISRAASTGRLGVPQVKGKAPPNRNATLPPLKETKYSDGDWLGRASASRTLKAEQETAPLAFLKSGTSSISRGSRNSRVPSAKPEESVSEKQKSSPPIKRSDSPPSQDDDFVPIRRRVLPSALAARLAKKKQGTQQVQVKKEDDSKDSAAIDHVPAFLLG